MRGDQLARQWKLIQRLAHSRVGVGIDDLAEEMECVRRTVYRDLDALMYAGFPIVSEKRDNRVFYRFLESFRFGDVPFTPDEILALVFSEDLLRCLEGTVFHDSIRSAFAKIRSGLGPELSDYLSRLTESFRVLPGPHKSYSHLHDSIQILNDAVLSHCTVRMCYRTGHSGESSERDLDPYHVWYQSGGLYVVGLDHKSNELRTFAVDRIEKIKATDSEFVIPDDFDFDDHIRSSFGVVAEAADRVRIEFSPTWATYVKERTWHPSQTVRELENGALLLSMEVGSTAELRSWILSFGAGAKVLAPGSLRSQVRQELKRALATYRSTESPRRTTKRSATTPASVVDEF